MADKINVRYLSSAIAVCEAAYLLPTPPTGTGASVTHWSRTDDGETVAVPEVELTILAGADVELAAGAMLVAEEVHNTYLEESSAVTLTNGTEIVNYNAHGFYTGDGPIRFTGTLPGELSLTAEYWVIRASANTFQVATTRALALAGTETTFTGDGADVVVHWVDGIKSTSTAITSADATANTFTLVDHGLTANQVVQLSNSGGALPASFAADTDYYVVEVDEDTFSLSLTSNGAAYNFTDAGTGTHSVIDNDLAATSETVYVLFAKINAGAAVDLTSTVAYRERFTHRPGIVAYHLCATGDVMAPITAYVRAVSVE
jgi:hypothetical protein